MLINRTLVSSLLVLCAVVGRAEVPTRSQIVGDVEFARTGEAVLKLDLHLPASTARAPLIVWVHGGAWRSGSKNDMPLGKLVADGYAVASVDYRLSTQAKFAAQIHDLKAAIRFLRGHGEEVLPSLSGAPFSACDLDPGFHELEGN